MSRRARVAKNCKLLIALAIAACAVPVLGAGRWIALGPDNGVRVNAIRADRANSQLLYLGTDRGVFLSRDGGNHWEQASAGLAGSSVVALEQALNGAWLAGTEHGIFLLSPNTNTWRPSNTVVNEQGTPRMIHVKGVTRRVMAHHATRSVMRARINAIEIAPNRWLAATSAGIFSSSDQGKIWSGGFVNGEKDFISVKAEKELVAAATRSKLLVSIDGGTVWKQTQVSSPAPDIAALVITSDSRIFVATSEGLFRSADTGTTWQHLTNGLPASEIGSVVVDFDRHRLLAYCSGSGLVFESTDKGQSWRPAGDPGIGVKNLSLVDGRIFASTATGLLASPDKGQDGSSEASRSSGNWFLRLVHRSQ